MVITFTLQPTYSGATYVAGPFNISGTTNTGVTTKLASNVTKSTLLAGLVITGITDNTTGGTIQSIGTCNNSISWLVGGTTITPTPTPSPNAWLIINQDCGGSATLNTVSVNSVSMVSFTPLTSTLSTVRTNPSGVNYGNNNNTIMVGISNIPSGSAARILVSINNGAREYYTNYTTNPSPFLTVSNVLINSGDFVKVSLQCNI